jgi:hypothetical protein
VQTKAGIIHTDTYSGHTYHLLDTDGTKWWLDAEAEAISLGGHLVTINDALENQWILETFGPQAISYASAHSLPDSFAISLWTGLADYVTEGSFAWASGEPVGYTNWFLGEPAGFYADEDFAGMSVNSYGNPGQWHDIVGDNRLVDLTFGVVEVNALPEPSSLLLAATGLPFLWFVRGRWSRTRRESRCPTATNPAN